MTITQMQLVTTQKALDNVLEDRLAALAAAHPNVVYPEQFGAFAAGVADPVADSIAVLACYNALAATGGGTIELYHQYQTTAAIAIHGDQYSNTLCLAKVPGAGFYKPADTASGGNTSATAHFNFQGLTPNSLHDLMFEGVTFSGFSVNDYSQLAVFQNVTRVTFNRVRLLNNAAEGIFFGNASNASWVWATNCYASGVGMGAQKLSAYNLVAENVLLAFSTAINCGQAIEQDGRHFKIIYNHFERCVFAGANVMSTWASYVDANGVVQSSQDGLVHGNDFIDMDCAITTGDSRGHLLSDGVTFVPGNQGDLTITANNFIRCTMLFSGGADSFTSILFTNNYAHGSFTSSNAAINCQKGRFFCLNNTFTAGATLWSSIARIGDTDPVHTSGVFAHNRIIGKGWVGAMCIFGPEVEHGDNTLHNVPIDNGALYDLAGSNYANDGPISRWSMTDSWMVQSDNAMWLSPVQPGRMKVRGGFPTKGTWPLGFRAENVTGVAGSAWEWRVVLPGTADTIAGGVTATTTPGSATFTITAGLTKVVNHQWIAIVGEASRFQIIAYDPATGIGTLSANATGVTNQAVAFSPPTWESR